MHFLPAEVNVKYLQFVNIRCWFVRVGLFIYSQEAWGNFKRLVWKITLDANYAGLCTTSDSLWW